MLPHKHSYRKKPYLNKIDPRRYDHCSAYKEEVFKLNPELSLRLVRFGDEPSEVRSQGGDLGQPLQEGGLLLHTEGVKVLQIVAAMVEHIVQVLTQEMPPVHIISAKRLCTCTFYAD